MTDRPTDSRTAPTSALLLQLEAARFAQLSALKATEGAIMAERTRLAADEDTDDAPADTSQMVHGRRVFGSPHADPPAAVTPVAPPAGLPLVVRPAEGVLTGPALENAAAAE